MTQPIPRRPAAGPLLVTASVIASVTVAVMVSNRHGPPPQAMTRPVSGREQRGRRGQGQGQGQGRGQGVLALGLELPPGSRAPAGPAGGSAGDAALNRALGTPAIVHSTIADLPADLPVPAEARLLADYRSGEARVIAIEVPGDPAPVRRSTQVLLEAAGWHASELPPALAGTPDAGTRSGVAATGHSAAATSGEQPLLLMRKAGQVLVVNVAAGGHPGVSGIGLALDTDPLTLAPGKNEPGLPSWEGRTKEDRP